MGKKNPSTDSRRADLSEHQGYWLDHLRACEAAGGSIKSYAEHHGLSVHGLYSARKRLRRLGARSSDSGTKRVSFTKVSSQLHTTMKATRERLCRVRFPNGTIVEWEIPLEGEPFKSFLQSIARLP